MGINPEIFRMYDIRGIVGKDLTAETVELIGKAYATHLRAELGKGANTATAEPGKAGRQGTANANTAQLAVAVGSDCRQSSEQFRKAVIKGITESGCDVIDVGIVPTPVLYYAAEKYKTAGAVQITGSHNPIEFNGLKLCKNGWKPVYGDEVKLIGEIANRGEFAAGKGKVRKEDPVPGYMKEVTSRIKTKNKMKVVVDAGNGMAGQIAPRLLRALGCEVIEMYCELDGRFPNHLPDPLRPELMAELQERVVQKHADLGLGFDGDADRVGVVDEKGNLIANDLVLLLYARDYLSRNHGTKVIFDAKCSQALIEGIKKAGGIPVMWKSGHSLIKAKMLEDCIRLGGELSGHVFFAENYFGFDDGIYAACKFAEIASAEGKKVSELLSDVPKYAAMHEALVDCADSRKFAVVEELKQKFAKQYKIIDVDGVRIVFPQGWALVRASNTQPKLTVRAEAGNTKALEAIKGEISAALSGVCGARIKL